MQVEIINNVLMFEPENFTEHYAITEYIRQHDIDNPAVLGVSEERLIRGD